MFSTRSNKIRGLFAPPSPGPSLRIICACVYMYIPVGRTVSWALNTVRERRACTCISLEMRSFVVYVSMYYLPWGGAFSSVGSISSPSLECGHPQYTGCGGVMPNATRGSEVGIKD